MTACIIFVLAVCGGVTGWVLVRRRADARGLRYCSTLLLEHLALALQTAAFVGIVGRLSPLFCGITLGLGSAWFGADALLFAYAGLRMQWSLLGAVRELPTMAAHLPWRQAVAVLVFGGMLCVALGTQWASHAALAPWSEVLLAGVLGVFAAIVSAPLRRGLPMATTFDWNVRAVALEATRLARFIGREAPGHEHSESASEKAEGGVPRTLVPHNEVATTPDADRPLMRLSGGFTGPTHFDVRIDAGEKPHVVVILLESVRAADVGILGAKHGPQSVTPCFDTLAADGVLWRDFWASGTITSLAMTGALYGVPSPFVQRAHQDSAPEATMLGMPHIFADNGYLPAFFCDGPLDWENKRQFCLHNGFRLFYGAPSIKTAYPEAPNTVWHFHDEYLMRFHAEWLARQDARGVPTFSTLLTVSNHFPFQPPKHAPSPDVPIDKTSLLYRYLRCTAYTDQCLGQYIDDLRARGLDKKTIFLIMGDHSQQVNSADDVRWNGRYTTDGVRIPCLLYAPGRVAHQIIDEVAGQTDLLPTLLDIFDIQSAHHAVGTSLRRQCVDRHVVTVHPWTPGMVGTRFGEYRHAYSLGSEQSALYAMSDPDAQHDISTQQPGITHERHQEAERMRAFLGKLYAEDRIATHPGSAYLKDRLLLDAPDNFPATLEQARERLKNLQTMTSKRTRPDAIETSIMMLALNTDGLTDDERLAFAQLLLARQHIATVGELTDAEDARLSELDGKVTYRADAPSWERNMIESIRYLAHEKPHGLFRGSKPG